MRPNFLFWLLIASLVGVFCLLESGQAIGQTYLWENSQNDNDFSNLQNWSGSPPGFTGSNATWRIDAVGADRAEANSAIGNVQQDLLIGVTNVGKGELAIGATGNMSVTRDLSVGDAGGEGTLTVNSGVLNVGRNMRLGRQGGTDGFGIVSVDGGGIITIGTNLFIGQSNRTQNVFTLSDGSVQVAGTLNVAHQANNQGILVIAGGTLSAADAFFADGGTAPSTATLSISGNGSLATTTGNLSFANNNGGATATINISGNGTLTSNTNIRIGFGTGSIATLNLSGGSVNALDSFLTFGQGAGSQVTVNMTGGTINADRTAWANNLTSTAILNMSGGLINMVASPGSTQGTRGSLRLGEGESQLNLSGSAVVAAERLLINEGGRIDLDGSALLSLSGSTIDSLESPGVLASPTFSFTQQFVSGNWLEVLGTVNLSSVDSVLRVLGSEEAVVNPVDPEAPSVQINFVELLEAAIANDIITSGVEDSELIVEFDGSYTTVKLSAAAAAVIVDSFVFHKGYSGQGSPIDTGKSLAREGSGPQLLSFNNLINTSKGINGVIFDIQDLGNGAALSSDDFIFQVSPLGAFSQVENPPAGWSVAPVAPTSVSIAPGSPARVSIEWPDGSIQNRWLRITVKATANTGLPEPAVFYIGHLLGESTGLSGSVYTVAFADITAIRSQAGQTVGSSSIEDIDKNGTVSFADINAMRANVGAQLTNITIP
jgi:hypothetical protein